MNEEVRVQTTEEGEGNNTLNSERPEWLPEKFESGEALAKSYAELEKKMSSEQSTEATPQETKEQAEQATGLSLDKYYQEYADSNELSADSYAELEKSGLSKDLVDSYIQGQTALAEKQSTEMFSEVGGKENYDNMINWASDNLSDTEINAFNKIMESGNQDEMKLAITGMNSRFKASNPSEPKLVKGEAPKVASDSFKSTYEVAQAINDPRYTHDTAYRKSVEEKLRRSDILG
jgi:hypothetical protein